MTTTDVEETERERFRVTDDGAATWAMKKAREAMQRLEEVRRIAEHEATLVEEWRFGQSTEPQREYDYFCGLLIEYAAGQRAEADRKSISTPWGTVKSRASADKWAVDEDQLLPWAKANLPEAVKVKESISLTALKASAALTDDWVPVTTDGEMIPGVTVRPQGPSFTVEVKP